jgi:hypothetical protein
MESELPVVDGRTLCTVKMQKLQVIPDGIKMPRISKEKKKMAKYEELERNLKVDADLYVKTFKTDSMGLGVKAKKDMERGSFLFEYGGQFLTSDMALVKEAEYGKRQELGSFMLWFKFAGTEYWLDNV